MNRIEMELVPTRKVCTELTRISSTFSHKGLSSRQLFLFLYVARCREHLSSVVLLLEHRSYNSALALRRVLFETFLRGLWICHCATEDVIEQARQNKFELKFDNPKKLQQDLIESADRKGLAKENEFYKRGSGFVHGGLLETAMYALPTHPKVSENLSRTVCRELKYSTLRVLQLFLEYHLLLLKAISHEREHGISTLDAILATTESIQNIGDQYRSEIRESREKPSMNSGIEVDVALLEQYVKSGSVGNLCEPAYRRINRWLRDNQSNSNDALFKQTKTLAVKYAKSRSQ